MSSPHDISNTRPARTAQVLHVLAKPIGPECDIKCDYCFDLEKLALFEKGENYRMREDVLKAYIRQYIETSASACAR